MSKELGKQIRAARGLLGWHQTMLSARSGISPVTIGALEMGKMGDKEKGRKKGKRPPERIPHGATIRAIVDTLEKAGIEFTNVEEDGVIRLGVCLRIPKMQGGIADDHAGPMPSSSGPDPLESGAHGAGGRNT
jgi:hypothetical protein